MTEKSNEAGKDKEIEKNKESFSHDGYRVQNWQVEKVESTIFLSLTVLHYPNRPLI